MRVLGIWRRKEPRSHSHGPQTHYVKRISYLYLAKEQDKVSYRTDIVQFMAIKVLEGNGQTYHHDLEP